ncbi:immunity 49 family protein [Streptomyces laurentii]|uniref:immunity 49 family protein n=1 Tax=Streptomyces laurentii TaxID=39478 RepID=UPI00369572A5
MTIKEVTRHEVSERRIEEALDGMRGRAFGRWHSMRYADMPLRRGLRELGVELADHLAARTLSDPGLRAPEVRVALETAAECALGVLSLACFPDGDFAIPLPLAGDSLGSDEQVYDETWEPAHPATDARMWLDAFAWSVVSGLMDERARVIGPLLRKDYAPTIHKGVPYSKREALSSPAELAEMDALARYLTVVEGRYPGAVPGPVPLAKPDAAERARAAEGLDAVGGLSPDQRLLRVLLDDDQAAFEQALEERLVAHRESLTADPVVRSLLPVETIALAALACRAHGWEPRLRSGYLPDALVKPAP